MTHTPSSPTNFKVACVQASPVFMDLDATVAKTITLMREAKAQDAQLIAFPECWIPGYPFWVWLGSAFWSMQFLKTYHDNCLDFEEDAIRQIQATAKELELHTVLGYSERSGGSRYMGQCLIDGAGEIVFKRRKLKPTHMERTIFGEGDGSDLIVAQTALGRIGALCCWEHIQPLSKYAMYAQGEQIHVCAWPSFCFPKEIAHALSAEVNHAASRVYAVEGQVFVLAPCTVMSDAMIEIMCDTPDKRELILPGSAHTNLYAPDGRALAEPLAPDAEGLVVAEINLDEITYAKSVADPVGHYARPDATRLLLDANPKRPVESADDHGTSIENPHANPAGVNEELIE